MTGLRILPIVLLAGLTFPASAVRADDGRLVEFVQEIKPIFARHCTACHGAEKQKSGLRLDTVAEGINNRGEIAGFYFEARL
jgi:mono/diheme cytochrome c family protein